MTKMMMQKVKKYLFIHFSFLLKINFIVLITNQNFSGIVYHEHHIHKSKYYIFVE